MTRTERKNLMKQQSLYYATLVSVLGSHFGGQFSTRASPWQSQDSRRAVLVLGSGIGLIPEPNTNTAGCTIKVLALPLKTTSGSVSGSMYSTRTKTEPLQVVLKKFCLQFCLMCLQRQNQNSYSTTGSVGVGFWYEANTRTQHQHCSLVVDSTTSNERVLMCLFLW